MNDPQTSSNPLGVARVIWGALLLGEIIFLIVIVKVMWPQQTGRAPVIGPWPLFLFYIALALLLVLTPVAFFMRMMIFQRGRDERNLLRPQAYVTGTILFLALLEGAAFFGLVNLMLSRTIWPHAIVPGVAMILQALSFPVGSDVATPS